MWLFWIFILLVTPAAAQQFKGRVIVTYLPEGEIHRVCRAPLSVRILGCAMGGAVRGFGVDRNTCMVYVHEKVRGNPDWVIAHETAHCAGWTH